MRFSNHRYKNVFQIIIILTQLLDSAAMQRKIIHKHVQSQQPIPRRVGDTQIIGSVIAVLMILMAIIAPAFTAGVVVGGAAVGVHTRPYGTV